MQTYKPVLKQNNDHRLMIHKMQFRSSFNNISYNNNNVIITISRHIENPGIVRAVYSWTFSNIQPGSGIMMNIKAYSNIFRHY